METTSETPPPPQIDGPHSPTRLQVSNHEHLFFELQSLRQSYETLESKFSMSEEHLLRFRRQRDDAINENSNLKMVISEISRERDSLRVQVRDFEVSLMEKEGGFARRIGEEVSRSETLEKEVGFLRERMENLELEVQGLKGENGLLLKALDSVRPVKGCLMKILECLDDDKVIGIETSEGNGVESEAANESMGVIEEFMSILRLANEAKSKVSDFKEMKKKEKKELESSVVSLTEENRDINSLLRVALVEKEAVEKNLSKLKGNTEQKRVALLQFAERGLQRVGFGFMMGSGSSEHPLDVSGAASATASNKSDGSECEEEVVSLASTVERIMKNLRLEITQLRRSLEESRSDIERLQCLTEKQAQEIAENRPYIKELEDRERLLSQNIEELLMEIKDTETEVTRWREACELEVDAGKKEVEEREKLIVILKQELEKTKGALDISNGKLKLKEELAAAAMAAQAAAEKSLQLADSRAAGLRHRIEELTRLLEEAETRNRRHLKVRHICWPWKAPKVNSASYANSRVQSVRKMLPVPEMQALLHS